MPAIELECNPSKLPECPKELISALKEGLEGLGRFMEQLDGRTLGLLGYSGAHLAIDYDHPMLVVEDWGLTEYEADGKQFRARLAVYAWIEVSDIAECYVVVQPYEILDPDKKWKVKKHPPMLVGMRHFWECDDIPHYTLRLLEALITGDPDKAPEIYSRYIFFPKSGQTTE